MAEMSDEVRAVLRVAQPGDRVHQGTDVYEVPVPATSLASANDVKAEKKSKT